MNTTEYYAKATRQREDIIKWVRRIYILLFVVVCFWSAYYLGHG